MKKAMLSLFAIFFIQISLFSQVGIGTDTPAPGAILELKSSNQSLLITRVPNVSNVISPVNGMLAYDLNDKCVKFYEDNQWTSCVYRGPSARGPINQKKSTTTALAQVGYDQRKEEIETK